MNRKDLEALELSAEQVNSVMSMYGKSVQSLQKEVEDTKANLDTVSTEKTALEAEAAKVETLQKERDELKNTNDELNAKLSDNELDKRILKVVSKDAHDPDDIFKFIDKEQFEYDEETGSITNFDDVLSNLKESKPYLFNVQSVANVYNEPGANDVDPDNSNSKQSEPATKNYTTSKQQGNHKPKKDYAKAGLDLVEQIHGKREE